MPALPRLKPWYRRAEVDGSLVFEHGQSAVVFAGAAAARLLPPLLPLLDGTRAVEQIVAELGAASQPAVVHALRLLDRRGLLLDGGAGDADPAARFLAATGRGVSAAAVRAALAGADVPTAGSSPVAEAVVELLRRSGVPHAAPAAWDSLAEGSPGRLVVAAPAADELDALAAWNRQALAAGAVWLQVLPFDGRFAAVGPLYVPGETCCHACFVARRAAASGYGAEFRALDEVPTEAGSTPAFEAVVAGVAAGLVLRWLAHRDHYLPGVFYACEASGASLTQHRVHRVPRCPVCSGLADEAAPLPWFKEVSDSGALEVAR